ncbi:MAG: short-chain dehydrogenase [Actinotalea sp.]|nr:short-chain dehydrogenase [Actinotalea sp.]
MNVRQLEGRTAVVTGGGVGIGRAYVQALAAEGARVVVADIKGDAAVAMAEEIVTAGGRAVGVAFDQSDPASVDAMVASAESQLGPVDILVNNASLFSTLERKDALTITPTEWARVIDVSLNGAFYCCLAAMPGMAERGYGKVVNIASSSIVNAKNQLAHYVAAKSGVIGLTRALAREYGQAGITVNAVSPGATDSGASTATPEYLQSKVALRSIPRVQTPADLVGPVVFLCSPASDFITGQNLIVDGGGFFQ